MQNDPIDTVSHGLYAIPKIVIFSISEVGMQEELALEFEVADDWVLLEVGIVLEEDVVLYLRGHSIEKMMNE